MRFRAAVRRANEVAAAAAASEISLTDRIPADNDLVAAAVTDASSAANCASEYNKELCGPAVFCVNNDYFTVSSTTSANSCEFSAGHVGNVRVNVELLHGF